MVISLDLKKLMKVIFIIKIHEYGKEYSQIELEASKFEDKEEEATNSGH